jgi:hypothetical protein
MFLAYVWLAVLLFAALFAGYACIIQTVKECLPTKVNKVGVTQINGTAKDYIRFFCDTYADELRSTFQR